MFIEIIKTILIGIIEGITEWLPVSSTAHIILFQEIWPLDVSANAEAAKAFFEMFKVVIQLGAIMAVIVLFFNKLNPFSKKKDKNEKNNTWNLWFKVIAAVFPSAVLGLLIDEWLEETVYIIPVVGIKLEIILIAITLAVYGIAFILVERSKKSAKFQIEDVHQIDYRTALLIGAFQCLSLIPGTSRSGSTILGGILLGVARPAAAEFSFFLGIPTMLGASGLKIVKYAYECIKGEIPYPNTTEITVLIVGCVVSFLVSVLVIRALMEYVRKRSFSAFGIYRIILGALVIGYFLVKTFL